MLTEEQAKLKWCPHQRHSEQGVGGSYNRPSSGGFSCIASECMAWRWAATKISGEPAGRTPEGFCGLSVRPHG